MRSRAVVSRETAYAAPAVFLRASRRKYAAGWAKVSMRFQFEHEACEFVLSFGTNVEILEPLELREKVVRMARDVIDFYEAGASPSSRPER